MNILWWLIMLIPNTILFFVNLALDHGNVDTGHGRQKGQEWREAQVTWFRAKVRRFFKVLVEGF